MAEPTTSPAEMYVVESYGAGWYVYADGAWWKVPASRDYGWARRSRTGPPPPGARRVSEPTAARWLAWLGVL